VSERDARQRGASWQAQTAAALEAVSRLQELLAEGGTPGDPATAGAVTEQEPQLRERVLAVQLARGCAAYAAAGRSLVPLLARVEGRLLSLAGRVQVAAAAPR
jgi:ferric-dicitrate binding protein FerR (iron transport regulator)